MTCRDIPPAESMTFGSRKSKAPGTGFCDDTVFCHEGMQENKPQGGCRFG